MHKYRFCSLSILLLLVLLISGCWARLLMTRSVALRTTIAEAGASRALTVSSRGVFIADQAVLNSTLDKVFIEGDALFTRYQGIPTRPFGRIVNRNTISIGSYGLFEVPGEIYKIRGNGVRVRSDAGDIYSVLQLRNTGDVVLKLKEKDGWAYVQSSKEIFGWISLAFLVAASENGPSGVTFVQCHVCNGQGHGIRDVNCTMCHSSGSIKCGYCGGNGGGGCLECSGAGQIKCFHCNGEGSKKCERCFGVGFSKDHNGIDISCSYCGGNKNKICIDCSGQGSRKCITCQETGFLHCNYCQGSGLDVCPQCFKSGKTVQDVFCVKCNGSGWLK
ncbi:MAG TPA: hypothetical protein PK977_01415, partial [Chitinophagaceae bacterium]|nr:hypothetical protein [Chitinophagaceae bacterium]